LESPAQIFFHITTYNANTQVESAPSNNASTAPAPPTELVLQFLDPSLMQVDWADNLEEGVSYNLYRSETPDFVPDSATNMIASNLASSNFDDYSFDPDTRYYYLATAVTSNVESFASEPATEVTSVNVQPDNFQTLVVDDTNIEFYWADRSANETGFTVELYNGSGSLLSSEFVPPNTDSVQFTGLTPQTSYGFNVYAEFANLAPPFPLQAQTGATTGMTSDFVGLILLIDGHFQSLGDNTGMRTLQTQLQALTPPGGGRYRVWRAAEYVFARGGPSIAWNGTGTLFDRADALLDQNGTRDVAVIGYSHGASILNDLVQRLIDDRPLGVIWSMRYTAGIDGIQRGPIDNFVPAFAETSFPIGSELHHNFYNGSAWNLFSNPLKGDVVPGATNTQVGGTTHGTIQYNSATLTTIRNTIVSRITG
jgi:hypothetical protein